MINLVALAEKLPCFTKSTLKMAFPGSSFALDERIKRALHKKTLLPLKKGLYTTDRYFLGEPEKTAYREFIAAKLRYPSYLSREYVLANYGLLTEATYPLTSVTTKTTKTYRNFLGTYLYFNIKEELFFGFQKAVFYHNIYFVADKAKALFDFLYLKRNLGDLEWEIKNGLRINWEKISPTDFKTFRDYVVRSKSPKMKKILKILKTIY